MNNEQNKSSDSLYLEKLEFDPSLRKTWLNFFVTNFRVVILLIILISVIGSYSFLKLPRESSPEVKIPIAVVATAYPGVGPTDIEELVTKKIETAVSGLKGVKKTSSNSSNSLSTVTVEFEASENLDDSIRKLRDQVNSVKNSLPVDVTEPFVKEISFDDTPIWSIALTGPYDGFTMRQYGEDLSDELKKINGVRDVVLSGGDEREFSVAYDPQRLAFYSMSADQVNQSIKAVNLAVPSGNFESKEFVYPVRSDSRFFDADKLANLPIGHNEDGSVVWLRDVARVEERSIKKTVYSRVYSGEDKPRDTITLSIIKKTGGSILDVIAAAEKITNDKIQSFSPGVKSEVVVDAGMRINKDFDQLTHDFILTLILVFVVLFLIVGLKEALVAGLAVPLVFFVSFGVMLSAGISLNFLSIFSLILSLGLLVDDAIVVVSATKQYLRTGKFTPEEAVLLVLNDFKVVLTTTTLTTIWAFLPLLQSTGIIGEFIKSIPITVSVTLFSSLLIALMINHPLAAVLERIRLTKRFFWLNFSVTLIIALALFKSAGIEGYLIGAVAIAGLAYMLYWYSHGGKDKLTDNQRMMSVEWRNDDKIKEKLRTQGTHAEEGLISRLIHGIVNFEMVLPTYEKYLRMVVTTSKRRAVTLAVVFLLFVVAVLFPVVGIVPTEFFPASDQDVIYITLRASTGLKLSETNKVVMQVEEGLMKYPEVNNFSTIVGNEGSGGSGASGVLRNSSNLASLTVNLKPKEERTRKSYELSELMRQEFMQIQGATITVDSPRGGPPSGSDFEARISGDDLQVLDRISQDLKPMLAGISGVTDTDTSLKESPAEYTFRLDPARLELYNLNAAYVGSTLRTAIAGTKITTIIRGGKEIDVNATFASEKLPDLASIENLVLVNLRKQPVYIKDVAKVELKPSVDTITRVDQKRTVLLTAGVNGVTRPNDVVKAFQDKLAKDYELPSGYTITYGGENEQNTESVLSIIRAMVLAGILIISTLIIQFNSFKKAMIVLVTIPLALIGVFFGMAIAQVTLSFPGLIGILALFGIVVKNAIILIDKMNLNIKFGIPFMDAVVDAGRSRLEAIFITSVCTIIGIIPITLSNETWMALGSAVIFG
ncbi:efflux RND transporter permease subunit, partial [Candidatus Falkowbacteria bacterium]|nr:efflux RND transporter permease subunit [Candidatus Falkowbacteria bacterium]